MGPLSWEKTTFFFKLFISKWKQQIHYRSFFLNQIWRDLTDQWFGLNPATSFWKCIWIIPGTHPFIWGRFKRPTCHSRERLRGYQPKNEAVIRSQKLSYANSVENLHVNINHIILISIKTYSIGIWGGAKGGTIHLIHILCMCHQVQLDIRCPADYNATWS